MESDFLVPHEQLLVVLALVHDEVLVSPDVALGVVLLQLVVKILFKLLPRQCATVNVDELSTASFPFPRFLVDD